MASKGTKYQHGFTLVELLIALVVLLLIFTACFPLFTLATKTIHTNKARMMAGELAKKELESCLAQVTPANYNNESEGSPLKIGYTDRDMVVNGLAFTIRKVVNWVDDPEDGLYPDDKIPFDYKTLEIIVSAPSLFTGSVKEIADFKTFVAREGAANAISGLMVNIQRGWRDEDGHTLPVEGAVVEVRDSSNSLIGSGVSDELGKILFPINLGDDPVTEICTVGSSKPELIMHPNPDKHTVEVSNFSTSSITIEMEQPASLTVVVSGMHKGGTVSLQNNEGLLASSGNTISRNLASGETRVQFTDLWPVGVGDSGGYAGKYILRVNDLLAYYEDFSDPDAPRFERWQDTTWETRLEGEPAAEVEYQIENLWKFDENESKWKASQDNYQEIPHLDFHPDNKHRLGSYPVDLSSFRPDDAFTDFRVYLASDPDSFIFNNSSEEDSFGLLYKSRDNAALDDSNAWTKVIDIGGLTGLTEQQIPLTHDDLVAQFRFRFDSTTNINEIYIAKLFIKCDYENPNLTFDFPGQDLTVNLNKPPVEN